MQHRPSALRRVWSASLAVVLLTVVAGPLFGKPPVVPGRAQAVSPQSPGSSAESAALVTEFETNGLKVLVKRRVGSQTVSAGLFIRGGSFNITSENAGVEPLMLEIASEASQNFPRERMQAELSRMGTSIGSGTNLDYSALTLASTRRNFDRSWEMFTDVALRPSFTQADFDRIKTRMVADRNQDEDVPDSLLQAVQARVAYAGHPYQNDPNGTVTSLGRLTLDDVKRYYQQVMQTSHLLLVIVGDLDSQQIQKNVAASFAKLSRGDYHPSPTPQLNFKEATVDVTARQLQTNYVQGIFAMPPLDSADIYPMRVATSILRDRVFMEVRTKRNLSYAPYAFLGSQGANTGGIYVTAVDANQSVKIMLDEIKRLQQEPIGADDVTAVVQQFLTGYYLGEETNAAQAGELAMWEMLAGGWRNSLTFFDRLRAVTPADVQRVSKIYMRNLRFVVIGNPSSVNKSVFTAGPS